MDLLIWAGKVSLYWLFLYGCFHFFLRKLTHFRWNRTYLLASLLLPLALPFVRFPEGATATLAVYADSLEPFYVVPQQSSSSFSWLQVLGILYLSGAAFMAARLLSRLLTLRKLWQQATPVELEDGIRLYVFPDDRVRSFSFLNRIAVSDSDYRDHFDAILTHEMVHVRQRHTFDILLIEILRIVFWFHPVLPLYKKSLQEIHEYLADQTTPNRDSYAEFLIAYTFGHPQLTLVNNFYSSSLLKQRIRMLYSDKSSRWKLGFYGITGMLALLLVMVVAACSKEEKVEALQFAAVSVPEADNKIFTAVETNPEFPGGTDALYRYLAENIKYPEAARKANVDGRVFLKFVVRTDGSVNDVRVVKGIGFGCDQEAIRVVKNMPRWDPGKQNKIPVNVEYVLPINFQLGETPIKIQLEDPTSAASGVKPLFIVDGKGIPSLSQFSPADIESVTVLKGAEAIKAYGEEGKDGVIEITTKKKLQLLN